MHLAWFSPLPPERSGIAAYSAELLPLLGRVHAIDCYVDRPSAARAPEARVFEAHEFVWRARRTPYDLVVYQLGNAPCHDYMWAYLARYPGLAVLHDARLHHARARHLLAARRDEDYRDEFRYDNPGAPHGVEEYAVEGLGGAVNYFWPMLRVVLETQRLVAVHSQWVADDLRARYGVSSLETIAMGVPPDDSPAGADVRAALGVGANATVFAAFGKVTAEKRIAPLLRALGALAADGLDAYLLLVGDADGYPALAHEIAGSRVADRVRVTGHVADDAIGRHLAAADACVCLRWPTAHETSASWLRCLAAGKPTIVTDLPQLAGVPTIDLASPRPSEHDAAIAVRVDLVDEERALTNAMRRLATDRPLARSIGQRGFDYWSREHTLERMAKDYERILQEAAGRPAPRPAGLPAHFTNDYSSLARRIAGEFGVDVDFLRQA